MERFVSISDKVPDIRNSKVSFLEIMGQVTEVEFNSFNNKRIDQGLEPLTFKEWNWHTFNKELNEILNRMDFNRTKK